jgi:hypothetical protein
MLFAAPQDYTRQSHKAVTLLGMSGVGKTTLARRLPTHRWFHYSGDYRIGTKYLAEPILDNIKEQAMQVPFLRDLLRSDSIYINSNITIYNLEPVSAFLGKLGDPAKGGLTVDEFKRRQRLHRKAEILTMRDVEEFIVKAQRIYGYDHFINDAGGSLAEIVDFGDPDDTVLPALTRSTLILYIQATPEHEVMLCERAKTNPKPLFYREDFLDPQIAAYLKETGTADADKIDPNQFVAWIFPRLIRHRLPRYQTMADRFGYTVTADEVMGVRDETDFDALVCAAIARAPKRT